MRSTLFVKSIFYLFVALAVSHLWPQNASASWPQPIIAYYPGYAGTKNVSTIPWGLINQINVAFAGIDPNGTCGWFDPNGNVSSNANETIAAINGLKAGRSLSTNPAVKIVLSVGGQYASGFSKATTNNPAQLAQSCVNLMNQYALDGIDYDWEYPGSFNGHCPEAMAPCDSPSDLTNFTSLLSATKSLLGGKILSAALYVTTTRYYGTYDFVGLQNNLTQANIMAYDMAFPADTSPANLTGFNANFTTAKNSLSYFVSQGLSARKLILGLPFYSYRWSGVPAPGSLGSSGISNDSTQYSYSQVMQTWGTDPNCSISNDPNGSYFYCKGTGSHAQDWVSLDPPSLMRAKGAYIAANGYGGLMFWLIGQDDAKNSLLTAARFGLSEGAFSAALQ